MSCRVIDIYNYIDTFAPFDSQCEWDNSGLLVGSKDAEVIKTGFALDATNEVINNAIKNGCNLIITHHPVIFNSLDSVETDTPVYNLIKNGINIICAHTCFDKSSVGVNKALAEKICLSNIKQSGFNGDASMCFTGETNIESPEEFAAFLSEKLGTHISFYGSNKKIRTVAVCGGAGGDFIEEAAKNNIDAYVTGEIKHHEFLKASELNISVYSAGHYETEYPAVYQLKKLIEEKFDIDCVMLNQSNPVKYYGVNNAY